MHECPLGGKEIHPEPVAVMLNVPGGGFLKTMKAIVSPQQTLHMTQKGLHMFLRKGSSPPFWTFT